MQFKMSKLVCIISLLTNHEIHFVFVLGQVHSRPTLLRRASVEKTIFSIRMTVKITEHVRNRFQYLRHILKNSLKY